jgi:hypothetical protein
VAGPWNRDFLRELELFPVGRYRDQVDACSQAYNWLCEQPVHRCVKRMPPYWGQKAELDQAIQDYLAQRKPASRRSAITDRPVLDPDGATSPLGALRAEVNASR